MSDAVMIKAVKIMDIVASQMVIAGTVAWTTNDGTTIYDLSQVLD